MNMLRFTIPSLAGLMLVASTLSAADEVKVPLVLPDPVEVKAAMKKAASFYRREVSFNGGYAWKWPKDVSIAKGEDHESGTLIMIQPPGTPAMGLAMLRAYQVTGDKYYLQGAREAASALMWCQLASGGWNSDFDFNPQKARNYHYRRDIEAGDTECGTRNASTTLDDQKTQTALLFLLELAHDPACAGDKPLREALKFGLDGLLAAQAPNGGWPQHYSGSADAGAPVKPAVFPREWKRTWPNVDYTGYYTLNDGNMLEVVRLLLRAYELEKDEQYLKAAKKAGDFLLLACLPEPQPAWAQQYNRDMEPVWARKFEPPAISSLESAESIRALLDLWIVTGDEKYLKPIKPALAWLEKRRLPDGQWARFYELETNKPLYCKRDTYELTYEDKDLPTHYGFQVEVDFIKDLEKLTLDLTTPRTELLRKQQSPDTDKKWTSQAKGQAAKVNTALKSLDSKGRWIKDDLIDAGEFVKHFKAMSSYLEGAQKGGEAFEALFKSAKREKDMETNKALLKPTPR